MNTSLSLTEPTIGAAWHAAIKSFEAAGFESPDSEARALLGGLLRCSSTALALRLDDRLDDELVEEYEKFISRRLNREPAAYIVRRKKFMGFEFGINSSVLIPRPETELLVEDAIMDIRDANTDGKTVRILDVGTGSGCIAVSLARLIPSAEMVACDISTEALDVAKKNAFHNEVDVEFFKSDLMGGLPEKWKEGFDMIVSNPPYIVASVLSRLQPEISFEPRLALDGGEDGLSILRRLVRESVMFLKPGGVLAIEIGHDQGPALQELLETNSFEEVTILKDYSGFDRIAKGRKRGSI